MQIVYDIFAILILSIIEVVCIYPTKSGIRFSNFHLNIPNHSPMWPFLGDQYKPDSKTGDVAEHVLFKNNLFLHRNNWLENVGIVDSSPVFGDPKFAFAGGLKAIDYLPSNLVLIKNKGLIIELLPNDKTGLIQSLNLKEDILGNPINDVPSIGAIDPRE